VSPPAMSLALFALPRLTPALSRRPGPRVCRLITLRSPTAVISMMLGDAIYDGLAVLLACFLLGPARGHIVRALRCRRARVEEVRFRTARRLPALPRRHRQSTKLTTPTSASSTSPSSLLTAASAIDASSRTMRRRRIARPRSF